MTFVMSLAQRIDTKINVCGGDADDYSHRGVSRNWVSNSMIYGHAREWWRLRLHVHCSSPLSYTARCRRGDAEKPVESVEVSVKN